MAKSHSIIIGFTKEICDMVDNSSQEYKNKFIYRSFYFKVFWNNFLIHRCDICEGGHDFELFEDFGSHKREAHGIEFKMHSPRTPRHKPIPIKREMFEIEDEEVNNNMGDTPSSSNNRRRSGRAHKPTSFIRDSFETLQIGREGILFIIIHLYYILYSITHIYSITCMHAQILIYSIPNSSNHGPNFLNFPFFQFYWMVVY